MNKILMILMIISIVFTPTKIKKEKVVKNKEKIVEKEEKKEEQQPVIEQPQEVVEQPTSYETRMTSYYPEEGENITASGLTPNDFETNENGWFTYQGKLVVATATQYLANQGWYLADGVHTYKYYEEITLNIDGVDYQAIVLDSCGSSMRTDRIDLFVSGEWAVKDTQIIVKE